MKLAALLLLLAFAAPSAEIRYFRYQRPIENTPQAAAQTCVALDPAIFAHAAPQLADLRLYRADTETPYVIRTAAPVVTAPPQISPLNLGQRGGQTVFDAMMPEGSYSDLELNLTGHDFIATVAVSGSQAQASAGTKLGAYTIFDLSRQRLGRSTVLHLPQSDFRFLHFRIDGPVAPENVQSLSTERRPVAEAQYRTVAESSQVVQQGRTSVIEFTVPHNVPVDRITFLPGATPASFSRDVEVQVTPILTRPASDAAEPQQTVTSAGSLLRVHREQDGHRIDEERLSVDAPVTSFGVPTKWTVKIQNGDDAPIQLIAVRLEMLARNLCFEAAGSSGYMLYYGDAALAAPQYDYAALFTPAAHPAQATAGPEQQNPAYQPRPDDRPFTERHPILLWVALALVIALLGGVAFRSVKLAAPKSS
jgi:hypothetical protein